MAGMADATDRGRDRGAKHGMSTETQTAADDAAENKVDERSQRTSLKGGVAKRKKIGLVPGRENSRAKRATDAAGNKAPREIATEIANLQVRKKPKAVLCRTMRSTRSSTVYRLR